MSTSLFKKIVVPIDLADKHSVRAVLPMALQFVNSFGSKLYFVHIISNLGVKIMEDYLKSWIKDQTNKCEQQIQAIIKQYIPEEITVEYEIGRGAIYHEVIQYASVVKADLIMISAVRPELKDYMLGPNASKIVRHAEISVMVIRE